MTRARNKVNFFKRHRIIKYFLIIILSVIGLLVILLALFSFINYIHQNKIKSFYDTKGLVIKGRPGEIMRSEPLGVTVSGGYGLRILYRTQTNSGEYTFSSGMIFIPNNANSGTPRPIVAWAHGTLGFGNACAPTRLINPAISVSWVSQMLAKGWVVTATDYAGFGTPGTSGYLVGNDEAYDVLNSVRAAQNIREAHTGSSYALWGHSQGGNSVLFSSSLSSSYAPELKLISTVASAPAAELVPLMNEQYGTLADWVIGPLVGTSWPEINNSLRNSDVMTNTALNNYQRIANQCILRSTLVGLVRNMIGQKFYKENPMNISAWKEMAQKQSAPILSSNQPLLVVESKTDKVVLPDTTALYIQSACKAGSNLDSLWIDNVAHQVIPEKTSSNVINWLSDRFNNIPNPSACSQQLPVAPTANF